MRSRVLLASLLACACAGGARSDGTPDAGPAFVAGPNTSVTVFADAHMSSSNRQTDTTVTLPTGQFTRITLHWTLSCPPAGCDPWDRIAELHIVQPGADGGETTLEVARLITPYGVGATWDYDVTDLAPILTGEQKFRLFVDTWVDGWMNSISLDYEGGVPDRVPVEVLPLWRNGGLVYGDPARPPADSLSATTLSRAEGESLKARVILTGHGQGNLSNCAEFCQKHHHLSVGETSMEVAPWRNDCSQNPVSNQHGSWTYPRAGWCPGSDVRPFEQDVTDAIPVGSSTPTAFALEAYENSCRPGPTTGMTCTTCAIGSSCDYNYNGHAEPYYDLSVQVIRFVPK